MVLAAVGVLSLVNYARGANDRAFKGAQLVEVLQVQTDVPINTPIDRVTGSVKLVKIPAAAKVNGALTDLASVKGLSTNAVLLKGEQVTRARFGGAVTPKGSSAVPDGYQEISLSISAPQVTDGKIRAGDRVGILVSYDVTDVSKITSFLKQQVLVTRVANNVVASSTNATGVPILVTFAVKTVDAEKIVNAAEFGKIWLTLQNPKTDPSGRAQINPKDVVK